MNQAKGILGKLQEKCEDEVERKIKETVNSLAHTFRKGLSGSSSYMESTFRGVVESFIKEHESELKAEMIQHEEAQFFHKLGQIETLLLRQGLFENEESNR